MVGSLSKAVLTHALIAIGQMEEDRRRVARTTGDVEPAQGGKADGAGQVDDVVHVHHDELFAGARA